MFSGTKCAPDIFSRKENGEFLLIPRHLSALLVNGCRVDIVLDSLSLVNIGVKGT